MKRIKLIKPNLKKLAEEAIEKGEVSDWEVIEELAKNHNVTFYREETTQDGKEQEVSMQKKDVLMFIHDFEWEIRGYPNNIEH